MTVTAAWKRYALTSLLLVLIPLPLMVLMRGGVYGLPGIALAVVGWLGLAILYWWPLGALYLSLGRPRIRTALLAWLASVPLFVTALVVVYASQGSRFEPAGAGDWGIYLSNTPFWFLAALGLAELARRNGRAHRVLRRGAAALASLSVVAAIVAAVAIDRYHWPRHAERRLRIVNARIIDPAAGSVLDGHVVWIDNGRITAIVPAASDTSSAAALDAQGRFLVPGLIDAHMHLQVPIEGGTLAFHPGFLLRSLISRYAPHRRALIESGVTAIREIGGAASVARSLRDEIAVHRLLGPRMVTVARLVTSPGGHPVGTIWPAELKRTGAIEARDSAAMLAELADDLRRFAPDGLKLIYGTIGRADSRLDPRLLRIAVTWGRANGLWVAVHAETADEVMTAVRSGATTIEHVGSIEELPDSLVAAAVSGRTWLDPTLGEWKKAMALGKRNSAEVNRGLRERVERIARLRRAGARFIVGTDAPLMGYGSGLHDELALLAPAGFSNEDLLRLATMNNAEAIGLGAELGRIAPGYRADIILVDADPIADLASLRHPVVVIRDGQVVHDRR